MKKIILFFFISLAFNSVYSQTGNSPYPIIFVHGLNSDDQTWNTMLSKISTAWNTSQAHTLYFVLNARGGDTTNYIDDVIFPEKNTSGTIVNTISNSSIYTIDYRNFWNRNVNDPRIIINSDALPGSNQSSSNESAIYKQGYALGILIDSVLRVTGATKVILLGHSMGGLSIREYLQRKENGVRKWWVDPDDTVSGHKVAKVITIGAPHLGTDVSNIPLTGIDYNSEAMRDMRITFSSGSGAYIFGNAESNVSTNFYNNDINCNGTETDIISGINSGNIDNPIYSLPLNIRYTWISSTYLFFGSDLAVPFANQSLYNASVFVPVNVTDTLRTNKNHIQETGDTWSLIRGLDEPGSKNFAYDISSSVLYSGFITLQSGNIPTDNDYFKLNTSKPGEVKINLSSLASSGVTSASILSGNDSILQTKSITSSADSLSYKGLSGNYYLKITGNSSQNPNQNFYNFKATVIPSPELNITLGIEGMQSGSGLIQDTVRIFLRSSTSPFNKIDSAVMYLNSSGESSASFLDLDPGNYYIQTLHRNALETWSSSPVTFANSSVTNFDFTNAQSKAYDSNLILKEGKWCLFSGDVNSDGLIDLADLIQINNDASDFASGYIVTDLTGDNAVSLEDVLIAYNNSVNFVEVRRP